MPTMTTSLPDVAETGMLTFYCHVIESQTPNPILLDKKAVEISHQLNPIFANSSSRLLRSLAKGKVKKELVIHINLRAKKYDEYAASFLAGNPVLGTLTPQSDFWQISSRWSYIAHQVALIDTLFVRIG